MMRDTSATADEVGRVVIATQAPETEAPVLDATTATRLPARVLANKRAVTPLLRHLWWLAGEDSLVPGWNGTGDPSGERLRRLADAG